MDEWAHDDLESSENSLDNDSLCLVITNSALYLPGDAPH